jgi:HK97 family phage prohead protease
MSRQFKNLPYFKVASEGRVRKGICAVFGNIDSWGDRIMPGAFQKTITESSKRVKHLWNHDFSTPPIASITEIKEVQRAELPPEVLEYAPEATGGLMVAREYYEKNELADWVLQAIDKGDVVEMSFGYEVLGSADSEENDVKVRNLTELKLFDTSDVLWGMNAATVASGAKNAMPLGVLCSHLTQYADEVKAGRRNAAADMDLIKGIHGSLVALGYGDCMPLEETPKSDEAGAAVISTPLDFLKLKTESLRLRAGATQL